MPQRYKLSAIILFCVAFHSSAQYHYATWVLDLDTISNQALPVDRLGQILAHGYLSGKLKAYRFSKEYIPAKWTTIPLSDFMDFDPGDEYYRGDKVVYHGKAYQVLTESTHEPPPNLTHWAPYTNLRSPVSYAGHFPTLKDTLTKSEFLRRMIKRPPAHVPEWNKNYDYYSGDLVKYNLNNFIALVDHRNQIPKRESEFWASTDEGQIEFGYLEDLKNTNVLYAYSVLGRDTAWVPQIINVSMTDESGNQNEGIHFYVDEALRYLDTVTQPAIFDYNKTDNIFGPLTSSRRAELLKIIKSAIREKKLNVLNNAILNPDGYQKWLNGPDNDEPSASTIIVSPDNSVVRIMEHKSDNSSVIAVLPANKVEHVLRKNSKPISLPNYSQYLRRKPGGANVDYELDSVAPTARPLPKYSSTKKRLIFEESYTAPVDSTINSAIYAVMPAVWKEIQSAMEKKVLQEAYPVTSYCKDVYPWSRFSPWRYDEETNVFLPIDFTFSQSQKLHDCIPDPDGYAYLRITYRKNPGEKSFQPTNIGLIFGDYLSARTSDQIFFNWSSVRAVLKPNPQTESFIRAVERATLQFTCSDVAYGLREQ